MFTKSYLSQLQSIVASESFIETFHEILSFGTICNSYVLDNFFLPEELTLLKFHRIKAYIMVSRRIEKVLLVIFLIVKIVVYGIFLRMIHDRRLFSKDRRAI